MATFFLISPLILLLLLSFSSPAFSSSETIANAVETLSNSGYLSMALTLQLTSTSLDLTSQALTIFAPSDLAFAQSGQPSFPELQYHISPVRLTKESLKTLTSGARIPTLCPNHSLFITDSPDPNKLLINDVFVQDSAIFDDGYAIIFGIDEFFRFFPPMSSSSPMLAPELSPDSSPSRLSLPPVPSKREISRDGLSGFDVENDFSNASSLLISRGYTIMGAFLDMQLGVFLDQTRFTVFAPVDEAIATTANNFTDYSSIFRGHVIPDLLGWKDLAKLENGVTLSTATLKGSMINVTWSGDILLLNGVPVIFPDMYNSNSLAIHGVNGLIVLQETKLSVGESFSELGDTDFGDKNDYQNYTPELGDYGP